jgi:diguanylate cyclase (GGDEF)-like protein
MIPFTTCVLYLRQQSDDSALAAYAFGQNAELIRGRSLASGRGIAGWVIINGRPMSNTDPMLDLAGLADSIESSYKTAAVYPLKNGEDAMGALALYSSDLDFYNSDHQHLLESVARLASTALQHAILHEQTKTHAQTDGLTGLPNGRALYARFDQELAEAEDQGAQFTVLSFDVSGMRAINDAYGYQAGDRMLAAVAGRLRAVIDESYLLSRVAGDELVCLLRGCSRDDALKMGERVKQEISRFKLEVRPGQTCNAALNFGVAEYPADGRSIDELLGKAALATRENKITHDRSLQGGRAVIYPFPQKPDDGSFSMAR